jgi:hypothetical protein
MNPDAVAQAKARLKKAHKALVAFRAAEEIGDAEEAWSDFLLAASTIYSKLEQGAKGHPKSQPWFGMKKRERKDDPLLRYLHFARNSDEHGIERVAASTGPNRDLAGRPLKFNERVPLKAQKLHKITQEPEGALIDVVLAGPTLKPVRVNDRRYGDYCDPPKTHIGKEILYSDFVDHLAETALPYLLGMLEEAEELSKTIAK